MDQGWHDISICRVYDFGKRLNFMEVNPTTLATTLNFCTSQLYKYVCYMWYWWRCLLVFRSANGKVQAFDMRESAPMLASQGKQHSHQPYIHKLASWLLNQISHFMRPSCSCSQ
ncbi:uncharacterized protein LOC141724191 [Apium graveolens]|uniref:uncharacterized protein LOC141724191 n=1 Tax=Apium graveolens TaxID=4045 RepID=UPI003D791950